jgi:hypothetical protein
MKYKVIYQYQGSSNAGMAQASFYTKSQAIQSADEWRQIGDGYYAFYWDGSNWNQFSPIP